MIKQNQGERVQLNLDITSELYETINNLKEQMNGDTAEVLLKAIALLEVTIEAKQKGRHIWITDDKQNLETEIVGF
ncbi:DNA-binding protein (plasmid) [Nostoc sp. TCL26-01]|nr:DNA-binding protein [Nostoc sp. TCL26-01]